MKSESFYSDKVLNKRASLFLILTFIIIVMIIIRLIVVQVVGGLMMIQDGNDPYMKKVTIKAPRGGIYDNSGNIILAKSVNKYDIAIDQSLVPKWNWIDCNDGKVHLNGCYETKDGEPIHYSGILGLAEYLSPYLNIDIQHLAYLLTGTNKHRIIAKGIEPNIAKEIRELGIPQIGIDLSTHRVYPQNTLAGSIVGGANAQTGGGIFAASGLELLADEELAGVDGVSKHEVSRDGMIIPQSSGTEITKLQEGLDIKSSIDGDVQWKLQQTLNETRDKYKSNWVQGGVLNIKTGEILAIASDNEPNAGGDDVKEHGSMVMSRVFEPGSTMKVITASGLINEGISTPETKYTLPNHELRTDFAPDPIKDATTHMTGPWTLAGIIANSFNTGTVIASRPWPLENRYKTFTSFGFGRLTGSNFPGETAGIFSSPDQWDGRTRDTILFGQGIGVSSLQLLKAYATIANNGVEVIPTFISATRQIDSGNDWKPYENPKGEQVISPQTASKMMGILETCIQYGICKQGQIPNYRIGAKTGTAEQIPTTNIVHSFIGVFPMDNPQYVIGIWSSNIGTVSTNNVTIPSFKDVANFVIQKYGINASPPAGYVPLMQ